MGKEKKQQPKRRNYLVKQVRDSGLFRERMIGDKRRHLINELHEHEADEDLFEWFGIGKAPKE
jgi:hypothetical protein